jgi:hypothetical protein
VTRVTIFYIVDHAARIGTAATPLADKMLRRDDQPSARTLAGLFRSYDLSASMISGLPLS